jgi:DEAD/DEAH box helicase domain-containing protein
MVRAPFSQKPTIYLYDNYPGGIGLSWKVMNDPLPVLIAALDRVHACQCAAGCPSCVGPMLEVGEVDKNDVMSLFKLIRNQIVE